MTAVEETLTKAGFSTPRTSSVIEELSSKQAEMQTELTELRTLATAVPQVTAAGRDDGGGASEKEAMYAALRDLRLTVSELRSEMTSRLSATSLHSASEGDKQVGGLCGVCATKL